MTRLIPLALADLRANRSRSALTALIVSFGVIVMVALQTLVASWDAAVTPINAGVNAGGDWVVIAREGTGQLDPDLVEALSDLPDVLWAVPRKRIAVTVLVKGELEDATLFAIDTRRERELGLLEIRQGTFGGETPGVGLRADVVDKLGLKIGDPVSILLDDGRQVQLPLQALLGRKGVGGAGGHPSVVVDHLSARQMGLSTEPDESLLAVEPGAKANWAANHREWLVERGGFAFPAGRGYQGRAGAAVLLLVFSLFGPVLGSFLIYNSFALILHSRRDELALWRVLGATRRQILLMLALEGLVLGLAGGLIGVVVGPALAGAALKYLTSLSFVSPWQAISEIPVVMPWWIPFMSVGTGMLITAGASLRPAFNALRHVGLPGAINEVSTSEASTGLALARSISPAKIGVALIAATLVASALRPGAGFSLFIAVLQTLAMLMTLPAVLSWIATRFPTLRGQLGASCTIGIKRVAEIRLRAASSARALMVAVALLVAFGAVTDATWQATRREIEAIQADLVVSGLITLEIEQQLRQIREIETVLVLHRTRIGIRVSPQRTELITAWVFDPRDGLPISLRETPGAGVLDAVQGGDAILLGEKLASSMRVRPGDTVELLVQPGGGSTAPDQYQAFRVAGIAPEDWDGPSTIWLGISEAGRGNSMVGEAVPAEAFVTVKAGIDPQTVRDSILANLPHLKVKSRADLWNNAQIAHREKLGPFLMVLYVLAVFAAVGITQTAFLTFVEQKKEMALLRAAGATSWQALTAALVQNGLAGIVGGFLGGIAGVLVGYRMVAVFAQWFNADLTWEPTNVYLPLAIAIVLSLGAALPVAARVARQPVAQNLRNL